jgi:thiol-disulfide isomerase/thioredoxin|tara:strand:+ start:211 stop:783 length:573 start_codon:yes stop_codon:yes gene_type:complete
MRPNFIILGVIILAAIGSAYYFQNTTPQKMINYAPVESEVPKHQQQQTPMFSVKRFGDETRTLLVPRDTEGKVVLLNFWASWCAPCVAEFPLLLEISNIYADHLVFLGLSSDLNEAAIDNFFKNINYSAAENEWIVFDEGGNVTRNLFQSFMLPETLLIDQEGYIVKKFVGAQWTKEEMTRDIDALLNAE